MSDTHDVIISGFDLDRLEHELAEAKEQRDRLAEAMHVIVDVAQKNLDKPHPTIERVYAKALDSVKGAKP